MLRRWTLVAVASLFATSLSFPLDAQDQQAAEKRQRLFEQVQDRLPVDTFQQ